jgi:Baseplate J-like protein
VTTLPPELVIDDLTFADLLKVALDDVPGSSDGAWTLHGAVDPGITLLELFAWRFEQRLYAAEQVTEPLIRASLRLLGLGDFRPAQEAVTVLSLRGGGPAFTLPGGSAMVLQDDDAGRRFATADDVDVLPVHGISVAGRAHSVGDQLELILDRDGPIVRDCTLSLLPRITSGEAVRPEWRAAGVNVPPPATLDWTAIGPDGAEQPVDPKDGTGGLRRSGIIRVDWPAVWNRVGGNGFRLRGVVRDGFFTEPVRVVGANPNAVVARHLLPAETDVTDQLPGLLVLPRQRITLPGTAGILCNATGSAVLHLAEIDGLMHEWRSVSSWVGVGPGERVFVVDRERGELVFGDGRAGRVPRPAADATALVRHQLGGGPAGNLGHGRAWAQEGGAAVGVNPVRASDGENSETIDDARRRAADDLARADRTVTRADIETLAMFTPGVDVARVKVSNGHHPGFPCVHVSGAVTVTVAPGADRTGAVADWTTAPEPDAGLLEAVRRRLEAARLLGQEVFVCGPRYHLARVRVTLTRSAGDEAVAQRVTDALRRYLDALKGGHDGEGWPFGGAVRLSDLLGVAGRAVGSEATVTNLSVALDDGPETSCGELTIGQRDLIGLVDVLVSQSAVVPTGGGLQ